jgi:hypothetical protein
MIYCPKCGTANRDGSRFCNECSERLSPQTQVICPHCGTWNSIQSAFCSECGGRLLPSSTSASSADIPTPIKGLSLPTKASMDEVLPDQEAPTEVTSDRTPSAEDEVPGWLRELGAIRPTLSAAAEAGPAESADEIPEWLRDLRASLPEEPVAEVPQAGREEEEQLPDWLAELRPAEEPAGPEPPIPQPEEAEEAEIPDWLAELRPAKEPAGPEPPIPQAEEAEEAEIPDWLAELRPAEEPARAEPPIPQPKEAEEAEIPDWLAELRPAKEPARAEPPIPQPEEAEIPDWLAELRPAEEPARAEPPIPQPEEAEKAEIPDWLAELRPAMEPARAEPPIPQPEEAEEAEIPDWLAELRPAEEPARAEPPIPQPEEAEIPDWLAEAEPPALEAEAKATPSAVEETPKPTKVPDWLTELQVGAPAEIPPPVAGAAGQGELPDWLVPSLQEEEPLVQAEIPEWLLTLKPRELGGEKEETEGPAPLIEEAVEETGLLAGLQGTLPAEMLIAQPRAATAVKKEELSADTPQARLFAEIVGQPPEVVPQAVAPPRADLRALLPRWILYLALIAVVTLPFLLAKPLLPREIEPSQAVIDLSNTIEFLGPDASVLVAFDYDPTTSGEMDVVAQTIVGHLMDRGVRLAVVSLLPAGPPTAQHLLEQLAADRPRYAEGYGQSYANLGYLPGGATAVRLMSESLETALPRDFQGTPQANLAVMEGITSTKSLDLIVELAAGQDTLRSWIEQAGARYGTSLGAGVSAAIEPIARSYYEAEPRQLVGMIGGVVGAAMYESVAAAPFQPGGMTAARLDSQLGGHMVLVLVLLVGGGVYLARSGRGTRRER